jgi:ATP-dependent helicase HrpB
VNPLPIDAVLPEVVQLVVSGRPVVLEAPPGAGKTTRVPIALARALGGTGDVVVLEPRRLAAKMAARRMADELGEPLGETVGYQVRFERVAGPRTRVHLVTEGVLTRRLVADPRLSGVQVVVLDEFHERHLHGDVALALVARLRKTVRPDLCIVVMSATLDTAPVARFLDAVTVRCEGRRFAVGVEHAPAPDDRPLASQVASGVRSALQGSADGHVLVFLPGALEIRKATEACQRLAAEHDARLLPLHGDLGPDDQDRAVAPSRQRKIILATNVAESSVTVEDVVAVVDTGLARVATHDPWSGISSLKTAKVSQASATQRAGRAGRTREGRSIRLYTLADYKTRLEHDPPEIARADLAQTLLELAASGIRDLEWFEAPPEAALEAARTLLRKLGALDAEGRASTLGQDLAKLPLHPRQGRVLREAEARGASASGAIVAALLGERDLRVEQRARLTGAAGSRDAATEPSDVLAVLSLFREAEASGMRDSMLRTLGLDAFRTRTVAMTAKRIAGRGRDASTLDAVAEDLALQRAILAGYPDRVAKRGKGRALALAYGGSAELHEDSVVRHAPWMVAVGAETVRGSVVVRLASAIEPEWLIDLAPEEVVERDETVWDAAAERVVARSRMTWGGLVLHESEREPEGDEASALLASQAAAKGWHVFDESGAVAKWLARASFARSQMGEAAALPEELALQAFASLSHGRRSFRELREANLVAELEQSAPPTLMTELRAFAPEHVQLPGGRRLLVHYDAERPPWVESRLQDFFGMATTPTVAKGRVPLVLHLLAPNRRAVQVTTDLAGFWARHYPAIRKELARRYPRHSWPDDPLRAAPPAPRR